MFPGGKRDEWGERGKPSGKQRKGEKESEMSEILFFSF